MKAKVAMSPQHPRPYWTYTGKRIDVLRPEDTPIDHADIYRGLLHQRRYAGHTWKPISILDHLTLCVSIARRLDYSKQRIALCAAHDMHEAYVLDLPAGLKDALPEYKERIENPWEAHVHHALGYDWPLDDLDAVAVKVVDRMALAVEVVALEYAACPDVLSTEGLDTPDPIDVKALLRIMGMSGGKKWVIVCGALYNANMKGPT